MQPENEEKPTNTEPNQETETPETKVFDPSKYNSTSIQVVTPEDTQEDFQEETPEDENIIKDQAPADDDYDEDDKPELFNAPVIPPTEDKKSFFAKHKLMFVVAGVVLLLFATAGAFLLMNGGDKEPVASTEQKKTVILLGAETSVVDGKAEVSKDGKTWTALKVGDALVVGQSVRTGADGRVVIAVDDGSALRVNNSSEVKVVNLETTKVSFANVSGEVYARVVPSERTFVVAVDDETYTAKGTAYKTVNRTDSQGVEVYHSAVAVGTVKTDVAEGKRYYEVNPDAAIVKKTTDIPTDQLSKDAFLAWNLEQDKKTTDYADKLGYLTTLEAKKLEVEKKAAALAAKPAVTTPVATAGIKLTATKVDTGIKLSWTLSGVTAEKGFKIVKSKTANPTFGVDSAYYISDSTTRTYTWGLKDGKTYNFRVCTYTGDSCTNYSNNASATAPASTASIPTGTLTLASLGGGKNVEWTLNGSAPNGYKLLWSTSSMPTYGNSSAAYYEKTATNGAIGADSDGTYYVRVCMYTGSGCTNYSNQITITLP